MWGCCTGLSNRPWEWFLNFCSTFEVNKDAHRFFQNSFKIGQIWLFKTYWYYNPLLILECHSLLILQFHFASFWFKILVKSVFLVIFCFVSVWVINKVIFIGLLFASSPGGDRVVRFWHVCFKLPPGWVPLNPF